MDKSIQIDTFLRFTQVSRETLVSLKKYESLLINANKKLNLIGKSTNSLIWHRHFLDSAQVIDFVDKNDKTMIDLGSGAGFPGLIIALIAKDRKMPLKIKLLEKSPKKIKFMNEIINELALKAEIINQNIDLNPIEFSEDVLIARAFRPLQNILKLIHNNAKNWKKILLFLGKTGKMELQEAAKSWNIEYKQSVSITSSDSIIIKINKLEKK